MTRVARRRQWTEEACYHLINRGRNRETIFRSDADRQHFLDLLKRYQGRFEVRCFHYCLMSNHFHLAVQLKDPRQLSAFMAGLQRSYVHYFNRRYRFVGHLFQGRFKSPSIQRDSYLLSCGRYIERNPLAAKLVSLPWDYPWSSCRYYALGEANALLSENPCYSEFAATAGRRQQLWQEFLLAEDPKEAAIQQHEGNLGDEEYQTRLAERQGRYVRSRRGRPAKAEPARV